ncbi:MAG TPA: dienelactone hydrolase family protein [Tepidisphaeraceae bacterium]|nr:dienelactone hydrolase family protein [Tepidisphaeraceae bacterium]
MLRIHSAVTALCVLSVLLGGCAASQDSSRLSQQTSEPATSVSTHTISLPTATLRFDLYRPATSGRAPLVVVAHGLFRDRTHMAGWGKRLAENGFVVAIPNMPTEGDHIRNAQAINELVDAICNQRICECNVDPHRIGMVGLSFGGLSTLLAAADNPNVKVWVGLDPVDWKGRGVAAAPRVKARTFILRAPPSVYNQNGGGIALRDALPGCVETLVPDAIHIDPEWPSDWTMELLIGIPSDQRREQFARQTTAALEQQLGIASPALSRAE